METITRYITEMKSLTAHKLLIILAGSVTLLSIQKFIETYIYSDWNFLASLLVLIALDTITGIAKHWRAGTVSSKGFGNVIGKLLLYGVVLIVVKHLGNIALLQWVGDFAMSALLLREGISVLENVAVLRPGLLPKGLLKKLQEFDSETGEKLNP